MTVAELLARVSSVELTEWQAYEQVAGPLGQRRDDVLTTRTAFWVASALGAKNARLDKMLPDWDRQPTDWRHMKMIAEAVTRQFGGTVESDEEGE